MKKLLKLFLIFVIVNSRVVGQGVNEIQLIVPDSLNEEDRFGLSISLNGDYLFVGAPGDDQFGTNAGAVYIFKNDTGTWTLVDKIVSTDISAGDYFGYTLASAGDYLFVGTPITNGYQGAVYVFRDSANIWVQERKLIANDGQANDYFGYSLSADNDIVVIGAYGNDEYGTDAGAVYIFENINGHWTQTQKVSAQIAQESGYFGYSVATDGNFIVVGAPNYSENNLQSGEIYIFERDTNWLLSSVLMAEDAANGDSFGYSVDISDSVIIVGAPYKSSGKYALDGAAYVFERDTENLWLQKAKFTAANAETYKFFGYAVSIYASNIIVGAKGNISFNPHTKGNAYIFSDTSGNWSFIATLDATNNATDDQFGYAVSISDKYIMVGAQTDDTVSLNGGAVYAFDVFPPKIIRQPVSQIVNPGDSVLFSLVATGTDLSFQWFKNSEILNNDDNISGVNSPTLKINSVSGADTGVYRCKVSGSFGTTYSNNVLLALSPSNVEENKYLTVSPNPTKGVVFINLNNDHNDLYVYIYDLYGKRIFSKKITNKNKFHINLADEKNGIYVLKIVSGKKIITKKIIKL